MSVDMQRVREQVSVAVCLGAMIAHHDPEAARVMREGLLVVIGGPEQLVPFAVTGSNPFSCASLLRAVVDAVDVAARIVLDDEDITPENDARLDALGHALHGLDRLSASFHAERRVTTRAVGVA